MPRRSGPAALLAALLLIVLSSCRGAGQPSWLGPAQRIAPGIELYSSTDASLIDPPGAIAVQLLRLDPARVRLDGVLAGDTILGFERVDEMAARAGAIAAVNGGFFNLRNGEPTGLLKIDGELVSDTRLARGVAIIRAPPEGPTELAFDQVAVQTQLRFTAADREWTVPVDGINTTRERGKLMLYTPRYHPHTDTAGNGTEWVLRGRPLRVVDVQSNVGRVPIPRDGIALSFGGLDLPEALAALADDVEVRLDTEWTTMNGVAVDVLDRAENVINGAGLLRRAGHVLTDWRDESLNPATFVDVRHPRTLIGRDRQGFIWLAAIDGRRPEYSLGMTFADLQRLCDRLQLTDALNLDGGGSTTMVVEGRVVNRPSDPAGPRAVSDAILVMLR
jgi:hypothetical protein